uniref:Uncharacterized protein n=1 Tax=Anguilla anguilla TaxID=7936 RepID=A0A0E9RS88_ANGAN
MMCVMRAQSASTPDIAHCAVMVVCMQCSNTRNAENPTSIPKVAYPMLI